MTAAAVAEATGGSEPAGAQLGQRTRQQPARFGVADMELSAAHVRRFVTSRGARAMSACPSARASAPRGRRPRLKLRLRPPGRRSDSWRRRGGDSGRRKRGRRPRHKYAQPWLSHGCHGSGSHGSHRCSSHRSSPKEECARSLMIWRP